ncbi:hypothetical protein [Acinetobacter sp.]|uniref:hypothetical protein n=1 Tax=Acinetobacter sp. TaxID=472 RepID=UPI00388F131F
MKFLKFVVSFLLVALAACDSGVEPIKPTRDTKDFTVRLNIVSPNEITEVCTKLGTVYEANGCNAFHIPENFCDIYVMMPDSVDDQKKMAILGHELMHCRYGAYHQ